MKRSNPLLEAMFLAAALLLPGSARNEITYTERLYRAVWSL